jgi:hypothetical protein
MVRPSASGPRFWLVLAMVAGFATGLRAEIAAVSSSVVNGYTRVRLPDHTYKPETYVFAEGGLLDAPIAGGTLRQIPFRQIALTLGSALAQQRYVATTDIKSADLLIFVFWGATKGANDSSSEAVYENLRDGLIDVAATKNSGDRDAQLAAAERADPYLGALEAANRQRLTLNARNANILGFGPEFEKSLELSFTSMAQDLTEDLEDNRYFVVLKAYDMQLARKEKKRKLLWETRFSVRAAQNDFRQQLPAMIKYAGRYFGKDSGGLIRRPLPKVNVEIGAPVYLGEEGK